MSVPQIRAPTFPQCQRPVSKMQRPDVGLLPQRQAWAHCYDRKGCDFKALMSSVIALDRGLDELKTAPEPLEEGLAGLKTLAIPYATSNLQISSPNNSETGTTEGMPASTTESEFARVVRSQKI